VAFLCSLPVSNCQLLLFSPPSWLNTYVFHKKHTSDNAAQQLVVRRTLMPTHHWTLRACVMYTRLLTLLAHVVFGRVANPSLPRMAMTLDVIMDLFHHLWRVSLSPDSLRLRADLRVLPPLNHMAVWCHIAGPVICHTTAPLCHNTRVLYGGHKGRGPPRGGGAVATKAGCALFGASILAYLYPL
jgi:hypothetical protein